MEVDYVRVYQETTSSVQSAYKSPSVKLYPNPFNHNLTISVDANDMEDVEIEVQSLEGQVVYSTMVNLVDEKIEINGLEYLPAGVYFLRYTIEGLPMVVKAVKG